jgi:hypothetical protein
MNATAQTQFDIAALKRAFDAGDVDSVLEYYSDKLEHVEIGAGAPPGSPRTSDFEHIGNGLRGAAGAGIKLRMENTVAGGDRAACTITCEFPDGRRLVSNTIYNLEDGKIVRQFDVQVTDPEKSSAM